MGFVLSVLNYNHLNTDYSIDTAVYHLKYYNTSTNTCTHSDTATDNVRCHRCEVEPYFLTL